MPKLPNDRWELFAQGMAEAKTAKDSYIAAGYKPTGASEAASRLNKNPLIVRRIAELRKAGLGDDSVQLTRERVLSRLHILGKLSEANKQYGMAIRCEELIGKHLGMFVDTSNVRIEDLRNVPPEKLIEWLEMAERAKQKAISEGGADIVDDVSDVVSGDDRYDVTSIVDTTIVTDTIADSVDVDEQPANIDDGISSDQQLLTRLDDMLAVDIAGDTALNDKSAAIDRPTNKTPTKLGPHRVK